MRVLVTGGTGYLGSAIVRALACRGHLPVTFARHASTSGLPGDLVDGDVRNRDTLMAAASGTDALCHTAALVSVWRARRAEFDEINVGGLQNAIDVCRALRLRRLVYTSSFLARPPSDARQALDANDYQRTKARAREVALAAARDAVPIVSLYPGVIYGPGPATEGNLVGRIIRDHLAGALPGLVGPDRVWSYAGVEAVAEAHVTALERGEPGAEYLLGGENAPQIRIFEIVRRVTGAPLPRRIPDAAAYVAALVEEAGARLLGRPPRLTRGIVRILRHDWSMDSARSVAELDYRVTPLDAGIEALLAVIP